MDAVTNLLQYLCFPSVSTDSNYLDGMKGARDYISGQLEVLGFSVENIKTNLHPILLAERHGNHDWPHLLLYGHYDVQPADPFELWSSDPFNPEVRDGRIYARGAADNKGPTIVHMTALQRVLKKYPNLPLNVTYVIEGEEE
ncbi:MAG: M20/M25/M40 family metallo-hydrolase, partial [Verrucomicrobiota bacterium]|nr:M20/M25/M40 family metallo-hydrolase [Verrucomicrobiota bacterium]